MLSPADCHIADEHRARMLVEEGAQTGQNQLHLLVRHHGKDDYLTAGVVEQQVSLMKAMVPFAGYIIDNGVPGGTDSVQQISEKLHMLSLNDYSDFFHGMQRQPDHISVLPSPISTRLAGRNDRIDRAPAQAPPGSSIRHGKVAAAAAAAG